MFQSSHLLIQLWNVIAYVNHSKKRGISKAMFVPYLRDAQGTHEAKACVFNVS